MDSKLNLNNCERFIPSYGSHRLKQLTAIFKGSRPVRTLKYVSGRISRRLNNRPFCPLVIRQASRFRFYFSPWLWKLVCLCCVSLRQSLVIPVSFVFTGRDRAEPVPRPFNGDIFTITNGTRRQVSIPTVGSLRARILISWILLECVWQYPCLHMSRISRICISINHEKNQGILSKQTEIKQRVNEQRQTIRYWTENLLKLRSREKNIAKEDCLYIDIYAISPHVQNVT